jgi:glycine reductase
MGSPIRVAHFMNQFFGGLGGQESVNAPLEIRRGPIGPGKALQAALGSQGEVTVTLVAGDGWFNDHIDVAIEQALAALAATPPDVVVTGPAFDSGLYGLNCGRLGHAIAERLKLPVVSGMFPENPGVELARRSAFIVPTGRSAGAMPKAIAAMAALVLRTGAGEHPGEPAAAGYLPRGVRLNVFAETNGSERAVAMLLAKVAGRPFETEVALPAFEAVKPAAAVSDLRRVTVGLVTTGGIVPRGNPDRLESRRATGWRRYAIGDLDEAAASRFECIHGGFDGQYANEDPNRVVPIDVLRELEREGAIAALAPVLWSTTGNAGPLDRARRFGEEMARDLSAAGVGAVVLTAT